MFVCLLYKYVQVYVNQSSRDSTEDFILGGALTQKTGIGHLYCEPGNMLQVCRALLGNRSKRTNMHIIIGHYYNVQM